MRGRIQRSSPRTLANEFRDSESPVFALRSVSNFIGSYLVDPASSHMLVSKIKPCMSKYKILYGETADGSLKQLLFP